MTIYQNKTRTNFEIQPILSLPHVLRISQWRTSQWRASRRRGQNLVEFAIVVPILLALLMAILEAATLGRAQMIAANAAREGARTLSVGKTIVDARTRAKAVGQTLGLLDSEITFVYSIDNGATFPTAVTDANDRNTAPANSLVRVQVNHPHRALTGFYPFLRNYRNQAQVTMRRESN